MDREAAFYRALGLGDPGSAELQLGMGLRCTSSVSHSVAVSRTTVTLSGLLLALVAGGLWWHRWPRQDAGTMARRTSNAVEGAGNSGEERTGPSGTGIARRAALAEPASTLTADKQARVAKIKRDYEELRAKAAADYAAAGARFPGGLSGYMRQLALLDRERRLDLAAVLSARELEDLEYAETTAGQLVRRWLGDTPATEEQRHAVFRLQRAFEERFALAYDVSATAQLEREMQRQALQEEIRGVLGDALFAAWLRGEGGDFANFTAFMARQGLPEARAFELWQVKNEYARKRLELAAQNLPVAQSSVLRQNLIRQTEARVMGVLGPGFTQAGQREVLAWLPAK